MSTEFVMTDIKGNKSMATGHSAIITYANFIMGQSIFSDYLKKCILDTVGSYQCSNLIGQIQTKLQTNHVFSKRQYSNKYVIALLR